MKKTKRFLKQHDLEKFGNLAISIKMGLEILVMTVTQHNKATRCFPDGGCASTTLPLISQFHHSPNYFLNDCG